MNRGSTTGWRVPKVCYLRKLVVVCCTSCMCSCMHVCMSGYEELEWDCEHQGLVCPCASHWSE